MRSLVERELNRLSRVPGVRAAMVVDSEAGVPVTTESAAGVEEKAVSALAASLFRGASRATESAPFGRLSSVQLEAGRGCLVVVGDERLLVAVMTEPSAQLGRVRVEAARAAEALR